MAALAHHAMSYAEQKDAIDDDPAHVRLSTTGGKESLAGEMLETQIADYAPVKDAVVADEQALINEQFAASLSVTGFDQQAYKQIDQGGDGACTVMAIFHLIHLHELDQQLHGKSWTKIKAKSYWKSGCWNPISRMCEDVLGEWVPRFFADTLDFGLALRKRGILGMCRHPDFRYVPVRGNQARERYNNPIFFTDVAKAGARARYGEDVASKNPVTCAVGHFVESLLDAGRVVGVSWNAHARVIVAYNDTHLLFADSWNSGVMYEAQNEDYYVAGVSTVPKYKVYMYCRDFIYFDRPLPTAVLTGENTTEDSAAAAPPPSRRKRRSRRVVARAAPSIRPIRTDFSVVSA